MSKKHKKSQKRNEFLDMVSGELSELADVESVTITLNRMTSFGLRSLGKAMVDIVPHANGKTSEAQLTCWAAHLFMLIFQQEDVQKEISALILEAKELAELSEFAEKILP